MAVISYAVVIVAIALAVLKAKPGTPLLLAGVGIIIFGISSVTYGNEMNRSPLAFWQYGPNPGNQYLFIGYVAVALGVAALALGYWRKNKNS